MENRFYKGDAVRILHGKQMGSEGTIIAQPRSNPDGKTVYTVATVNYPLGEWLFGEDLVLISGIRKSFLVSYNVGKAIGKTLGGRKYLPDDMDPMKFASLKFIFPEYNSYKRIKNGFRVAVSSDESIIPHVTVIFPMDKGFVSDKFSYVQLGCAKYLRGRPCKMLTEEEKVALSKFFNTVIPEGNDHAGKRCWDVAVEEWLSLCIGDEDKLQAFEASMNNMLLIFNYPSEPDYTKLE